MTIPTSVRAPRRDAAENREALLAAARVVLNRDPSSSLETIAAEAGLSRRSVYGHFATRDDLLRELVTVGARRVATALSTISHPDPLTRLALIASHLWREVESVRMMAVLAVRGPLAKNTASLLSPIRVSVREAIHDGQADGSMRTDLDPALLARLVEDTALLVLEESAEHPLAARDGHRLTMLMVLGCVGLGWTAAGTFIDDTPELQWKDHS
ncbi:TetR/AcrR family transcriptional regulator [Lacisediminihabitans changchengi]|uniref:TetR/AcrR family transcriptional regulator n=1 Tax=Lacisediminihabitans changchengi TaxID=2787634 RepID=UPI001F229649|nr:TetR/AcrR family transcriptional regulator [Lacisediminihabitans changchengi]